jgi:flagellar biosynthetic protein FliP
VKPAAPLLAIGTLALATAVTAAPGVEALSVNPAPGGGQTYTLTVQVLLLMTALSLLPGALIMMTAFTRVVIVLALLRQALGTAQTPSNQILVGLALFLTFFIMAPVLNEVNQQALQPYLNEQKAGAESLAAAERPMRAFMLEQTRDADLALFSRLSGRDDIASEEEVPFSVLLPAFATSELKTAFQIGFLLFIPFLVIDLVVASILMSMGMMMLSPVVISLPFKIMLFVLVDGWSLVMSTLASSFFN